MPKDDDHTPPTGKFWKMVVAIGLLLAIPASIAGLSGYSLKDLFSKKNQSETFSLTIFVHGPLSPQHNVSSGTGSITVDFSGDRRSLEISPNGQVIFSEVPKKFENTRLELFVEVPDYEMVKPDSIYPISEQPIYIAMKYQDNLRVVQGKVISRETLKFIEGAIVDINGNTTGTDSLGNFFFILPEDMRKEEYDIYISAENHSLLKEKYYPRLGFSEFRLKPISNSK